MSAKNCVRQRAALSGYAERILNQSWLFVFEYSTPTATDDTTTPDPTAFPSVSTGARPTLAAAIPESDQFYLHGSLYRTRAPIVSPRSATSSGSHASLRADLAGHRPVGR